MVGRPVLRFNARQIEMFHNHFKLVDSDADGKVNQSEFCLLFRSLGQTVTNARLHKIMDGITFEEFMDAFMNNFANPPSEKAVREALMLFDTTNTGYIKTSDLINVLTTRGDKLGKEEMDQLFELLGMDKNTPAIDYVAFAEEIYRMLPILSPSASSNF
ncbi:hypothetical protein BgAZ_109750 [Babesia gibsoni]|uniref:EF-hand domain-containing protein n=1 Tax=Babesia gibsoni TaxID=33632 RepID=A0AAD8PGR8_BABGI|nr:hypothetical protein BgAZ_109750 [Babesia gibsoni]